MNLNKITLIVCVVFSSIVVGLVYIPIVVSWVLGALLLVGLARFVASLIVD